MNVKQMKEFLNDYPDDMEVLAFIKSDDILHGRGMFIGRAMPVLSNVYTIENDKDIRFMYDDHVSLRDIEKCTKISALIMREDKRGKKNL